MIAFVSVFCYFLLISSLALIAHRGQKSSSQFLLGRRSLGACVTALSAHASDMSSWIFMGLPATLYVGGVSGLWIACSLLIGMWLNWTWVAPALRKETETLNCLTLGSYFQHKAGDPHGIMQILLAVYQVFFFSLYICAGFIGGGLLFQSLFGVSYSMGVVLTALLATLYVFWGGFIMVAWTDFFQAILFLFSLILVPTLAFVDVGSPLPSIRTLSLHSLCPSMIQEISLLGWGLGYFGQPHIVTKFMGIQRVDQLTFARRIGMTWLFLALVFASASGLLGSLVFVTPLKNPETVFISMSSLFLPPLADAFIRCTILSAIISTVNAQLLVLASYISEDVFHKYISPTAHSRTVISVSRWSAVCVSILASIISLYTHEGIFDMVSFAWAGLGSTFGPLLLGCLFWPRLSHQGAICGLIAGGSAPLIMHYLNPSFSSTAVSFICGCAALIGGSLFFPKKQEKPNMPSHF